MPLMKKLVLGCLVLAVLLVIVAGGALYLVWDYVSPVVRTVTDVTSGVTRLDGLAAIEKDLANTAPYRAPATGEVSAAQLERFLRVQRHVRLALGTRIDAFTGKYRAMSGRDAEGKPRVPSLPELLGGIGDLSSVYLDAWRAQVAALNTEGFSRDEFSWVRARVYQAAGLDAVRYDPRDLEQVIGAMSRGARVDAPAVSLPDAPPANRALVRPHVDEITAWLPMAVFGL